MKINEIFGRGRMSGRRLQILRVMKLTIFIMTVFLLQVSAGSHAQISFSAKGEPIRKVLKTISRQSGYDLVYTNGDLDQAKPVNIQLKNADIHTALKECFKGQPLDYEISQNTVLIRRKETSVIDRIINYFKSIDVRGAVYDENGEPLAGATAKVIGGKLSVTTDQYGSFTLKDVDQEASIQLTYLGYKPKELAAAADLGRIVMELSDNPLDEVQIQAYGKTSRRLGTGNISSVKAEDIAKSPVSNPLLAIQGRVPGVVIEQASGLPGSGVKVRIQGQNSISNGNDPLYVVDGVPYTSQLLPGMYNVQGNSGTVNISGNPLNFINPQDIESIEVLKDADATSIYGSRAAAGAILITTKKGKSGNTKFDVNVQQGAGQVTRRLDLLNTKQYLDMRKQAYLNDGLPVPERGRPEQVQWDNYDLTVWDQDKDTDWQKELIGGTAKYTDVNASLGGGSGNISYLLGGNYKRETTVFPGDLHDQKGGFHLNISNTSLNKRFKADLTANYMMDVNNLQVTDFTSTAITLAPNAPRLTNDDGSLNWAIYTPETGDPYTTWDSQPMSFQLNKYKIKTNNLISNLNLSYNILSGLILKTALGYTSLLTDELSTFPTAGYAPEWQQYDFARGRSKFANSKIESWMVEPQLTYNRTVYQGQLEVLLGSTFNQMTSDRKAFNASGYTSDLQLEDIKAAALVQVDPAIGSIYSRYKYTALFGRLNYNWSNKYIFNATMRMDGSSRFGIENRLHSFGSLAGAWVFSEAQFIKKLNLLSFGKLRLSYGTTGNDQLNDYAYLSLYTAVNGGMPYLGSNGLRPDELPNPYLQWEETRKLQGGIDLGFLQDRLLVNAGYFRNRSSNQLLTQALPSTAGRTTFRINLPALLENSGWEFGLSTVNLKSSNFTWTTGVNLTLNDNQLLNFPGLETSTFKDQLIVGQPINIQRAYQFAGVDPLTGIYQFRDSKGTVSTNITQTAENRYVLINPNQKYYGGFQNSFTYKGLQLDVLFQFAKQSGQDYSLGNVAGRYNTNQPISVLDNWKQPGDQKRVQQYSTYSMLGPIYDAFSLAGGSDAAVSDASYIRLKNLSLSYQLPEVWTKPLKLQYTRIFMQGQNLLTVTSYKGLDPENRSTSSLPPLKMLTFGLQFGL